MTIAQRFNAGVTGREGNESRQGRKNVSGVLNDFFRPCGASGLLKHWHPPLKRWAILDRPCGTF